MAIRTQVREFLTLAIIELAGTNRPRRELRRRRANIESLEPRTLLTAFSVTNLNDAGAGSLRQAILDANMALGADTIMFTTTGTITLSTGTLNITDSVTITGPGANSLSVSGGNSTFRVFNVDNGFGSLQDVTISGITIRDGGNGTEFINGAGIQSYENLTLTAVAVLNNDAGTTGGGGGVMIVAGNLRMLDCTVAGNKARQGGGIETAFDATSSVIVNTTISGNQSLGFGGGVAVTDGAMLIRNSTITRNRANVNGTEENTSGGGVFGNLALDNITPLVTMHNTIVAGNYWGAGANIFPEDIGTPVSAASSHNMIVNAMFSGGLTNGVNGNIVGDGGTGNRDINTILNTTLANNGGPTQTHALVATSPAINAGSSAMAVDANGVALSRDQRGGSFPRRLGNVDIGAVEFIGSIVVDTAVDEKDDNLSPGDTSLREAIALANLSPGANTIIFADTISGQPISLGNLGSMGITETLMITGNGAANTIVDGQQTGLGILQISAGDVTLNGLTLRNGQSLGGGGAIFSTSRGSLTISQSTLSGNSVSSSSSSNSFGGAIYAQSGAVTISQSTLSGNSSNRGGAIFAQSGAVTISQSTLSGNSASSSFSFGGAIYAQFGAVTISQSTLSGNSASSRGGAIFTPSGAAKTIRNSIVAGNTGFSGADMSVSGNVTVTNSLIGRSDSTVLTATSGTTPDANGNFIGGTSDATKIDPKLGPLANNGGPTQTHALLTGSLAIDRGSNANAVDVTKNNVVLTTDQRGTGFTRIVEGDQIGTANVDMGGFEALGIQVVQPAGSTLAVRPTLQWTALGGATAYNIWVDRISTTTTSQFFRASNIAGLSHTVTKDLPIGRYRVWIQPVFGTALGLWNAPRDFFVQTAPTWTSTPATQEVSRPTFSWNALPGAVKYDLWIDRVLPFQSKLIRQDVTGTSFTPAFDLTMGSYRAWVRGVDALGMFSVWSLVYNTRVVPTVVQTGPLSFPFDRTPTFEWDAVTGAGTYEVTVRNLATSTNIYVAQSTTVTNWTPPANLALGGSFQWSVVAVSSAASGSLKSSAATRTVTVGAGPTITTPVANSSSSGRTPTFSWSPVTGATSYQLQVDRIGVQNNIIPLRSVTATSFTATTPLPAGNYRVWVRAVSGSSATIYSFVNFTITAVAPKPFAPAPEFQLTGLLSSDLSSERPVEPSRSLVEAVTTAEQLPASENVEPTPKPPNLTCPPDAALNVAVDQFMMELALHEF